MMSNKRACWPAMILVMCLVISGPAPVRAQVSPAPIPAKAFHLADYQGKVVLMDFWASWCKPCQQSIPWLVKLQKEYGPQGLVVVPVNLDQDTAKAGPMLESLAAMPVRVVDPEGALAEAFELEGMPTSILFDREGKVVARHTGFLPKEEKGKAKEILDLLMKGGE